MMHEGIRIIEITSIDQHLHQLSELLIEVVLEGASIGFLPPLPYKEAESYWRGVAESGNILWIAVCGDELMGTVQLDLCSKPNGLHRAEIAKLMVHPSYRQRGIARTLMLHAENRAKLENRTLLVLDTREGDSSNRLYLSLGYQEAGRIPQYAMSANGQLDATVLYYKMV
jgi:ribosomal protein S18 acetylase RimI-like enzyme